MSKLRRTAAALLLLVCAPLPAVEETSLHSFHFQEVEAGELIRFVSRQCRVNFIYDATDVQFNVSFTTGRPVSETEVVTALIHLLRSRGLEVRPGDNYYLIGKADRLAPEEKLVEQPPLPIAPPLALSPPLPIEEMNSDSFSVYKLQYHQGTEIEASIKQIASDLKGQGRASSKLLSAIQSMQWIKATNSLLISGDAETVDSLQKLVSTLDVPLKQVFIEVLVVETDVKHASDFGLQWATGGKWGERIGFGAGGFPPNGAQPDFAKTMQGIGGSHGAAGLAQIPIGSGFDLGVIGDLITHKGRSYLSLGGLVSALQADGESTIVLNQKLITQDNKNSTIFVGDNIPFTGSVVQTVGQSQQTTANIEYRDVGVSLSITPMLGQDDIITLELREEITESVQDHLASSSTVNGIRTTKTNMATHVHVPDKHFLVLSGMIRNARSHHKAGIPCLGGIPYLGNAFSKTTDRDEKRNVIIFVRPQIIRTFDDYSSITKDQEALIEEKVNLSTQDTPFIPKL